MTFKSMALEITALEIIRPGMLTTIQDCGRFGYRRDGVVVAGAMDEWSLRIANLLVGNLSAQQSNLAALEFFLVGPTIDFHQDTTFAIYGGRWNAMLDDQSIQCGMPYRVQAGQRLEIREATEGSWGYLAIDGGIDVPEILGSRSTHTRSAMGGFHGRALKAGDRIAAVTNGSSWISHAKCPSRYVPWSDSVYGGSQRGSPSSTIRFVHGSQWKLLDERSQACVTNSKWNISKNSDRMGYRLQSRSTSSDPQASDSPSLQLTSPFEMLSEPTTIGTIQLPAGGDPIILMTDAATTGGYPRIGHVAQVDIPRLAQQRPGTAIQLEDISLARSFELLDERERLWRRLIFGVRQQPAQ
jgi:antagonist of KipI